MFGNNRNFRPAIRPQKQKYRLGKQGLVRQNFQRYENPGSKATHKYQLEMKQIQTEDMPTILKQLHLFQRGHMERVNLAIFIQINYLGPKGCSYLVKAGFDNLIQLNLNNNQIGNEGCMYLSKTKWNQLVELCLYENEIRQKGCQYLSKGPWTKLYHLELGNNKIGRQGLQMLRDKFLNCNIICDIAYRN